MQMTTYFKVFQSVLILLFLLSVGELVLLDENHVTTGFLLLANLQQMIKLRTTMKINEYARIHLMQAKNV